MSSIWQWILSSVLTTAVLLAVLGGGWEFVKSRITKWLDNRFEEKLKRLEQQHDVMTRHLQSSIDREFDRAKRLLAKEFDVLSELWTLMHEAYWRALDHTSRNYQYHDFAQMSEGQAEAFIEKSALEEWQKSEIRGFNHPDERTEYFKTATHYLNYQRCDNARQKLRIYVDRNSIFMDPDIRDRCEAIVLIIGAALTEYKMRIENEDYHGFDTYDLLRAAEADQYLPLEKLIHARVWSSIPTAQEPQ